MAERVQWRIKGSLVGVCNCDWGCPCNFNAPPTYGNCQGPYIWYIEEGRFGGLTLDGLYIGMAQEFPGPLDQGHGTCQFIIDARADDEQRGALLRLLKGDVGGVFGIFASITETVLDPIYAPFEGSMNGLETQLRVPGVLELGLASIKNPVTGEPEEIQLVKPTGFTSTLSDLGTSTVCRYTGGFQHDVSGKYAEFAPYEYSGP